MAHKEAAMAARAGVAFALADALRVARSAVPPLRICRAKRLEQLPWWRPVEAMRHA